VKKWLVQLYVDGNKWGRPVSQYGTSPNDAAALLHRKMQDDKVFEAGVSLSVIPLTEPQALRSKLNRLG
jgi:hypothetical protein